MDGSKCGRFSNTCRVLAVYTFQAVQDYAMVLLLSNSDDGCEISCTEGQLTLCALTNRSLIYFQDGDYSSAVSDLVLAVEISPHDKTIRHTLGVCQHRF